MSNSLRSLRSFSAELIKAAAKINDADIRQLLSERKGEEYLQGGRLAANSAMEAQYAIKLAAKSGFYSPSLATSVGGGYDLSSKTKKHNAYQNIRDYTTTGLKGGLTGLGALTAVNALRGRFGAPSGKGWKAARAIGKAKRNARIAAGTGAALSIGDRAYRHHESAEHVKTALVEQNPSSAFSSPANELSRTARTGSFKSSIVHNVGGPPPRALQIGQKFRMP